MKLRTDIKNIQGEINIPGDKSISHRAIMLGAIANGQTKVSNFLSGADCLSTISCFQKLGVQIEKEHNHVIIHGKGIKGLAEPKVILNVGNSGTTARLMLGILAGCNFHATVIGDDSIAKRPMGRVTKPLQMMGVHIDGRENGKFTPISIRGGKTAGIHYRSPIASAQVKSAILFAGINSAGQTTVTEPYGSRDHSERMLSAFGCNLTHDGLSVSITGHQELVGTSIFVPGDISSAAFFLAAGLIVPNSKILLKKVGINPTRTGILDVLTQMGANLKIENERNENHEPYADLTVTTSSLNGIEIGGEIIPRLIDEIPIIALLATQANGKTVIKDAAELKVKETNRIDTVVTELKKLGANIEATEDGMIIYGKTPLTGAVVDSFGDHRIGMMLAIAALISKGEVELKNPEAIDVSFPQFFETLNICLSI